MKNQSVCEKPLKTICGHPCLEERPIIPPEDKFPKRPQVDEETLTRILAGGKTPDIVW